jgi:hypothetical protein
MSRHLTFEPKSAVEIGQHAYILYPQLFWLLADTFPTVLKTTSPISPPLRFFKVYKLYPKSHTYT